MVFREESVIERLKKLEEVRMASSALACPEQAPAGGPSHPGQGPGGPRGRLSGG